VGLPNTAHISIPWRIHELASDFTVEDVCAVIAQFRYLVVYPALTRQWERAWRERNEPAAQRLNGAGDGRA